jgi:hypothetical protein
MYRTINQTFHIVSSREAYRSSSVNIRGTDSIEKERDRLLSFKKDLTDILR